MGSSRGAATGERARLRLLAGATAWAAVTALALGGAGCGRKADPLPPQIRRAETTRDLRVYQENTEAVLTWSYPSMTTAGGPLPDVEAVEVWRLSLPTANEPPAPPPGSRQQDLRQRLLETQGSVIATLEPGDLAAATRGPQLLYRDNLEAWHSQSGHDLSEVIWYAVRTICCHRHVSAFSNIARLVPQLPPAPPAELSAAPSPTGVVLSWQAAEGLAVEVERSEPGGPWRTVTPEPVTGAQWLDGSAAQGRSWSYRLRSVQVQPDGVRIVGPPGEPITVSYPDVYPPPPPAELVCLPESRLVRLRWQASPGAVSYQIRRYAVPGGWQVLAEGVSGLELTDPEPPPGELTYAVRAVDSSGNQSEPATCTTAGGAPP